MTGLLYKEKNFNVVNTVSIKDLTNNISSTVSFDAQAKKRTGYWTSWVKGADKVNTDTGVLDNRRDLLNITIFKEGAGDKKNVLAEGFGSYLENVSYDENAAPVWTINDTHLDTTWVIPSDP